MWPLAAVLTMWPLAGVPAAINLPPLHRTVCGNGTRTCRPGEGNPTVTHSDNPYEFGYPADYLKAPPHTPDPTSPQYAPLVAAAEAVKGHHRLIYMCVADFDFRELAKNWHRAIHRFGLSNAIANPNPNPNPRSNPNPTPNPNSTPNPNPNPNPNPKQACPTRSSTHSTPRRRRTSPPRRCPPWTALP